MCRTAPWSRELYPSWNRIRDTTVETTPKTPPVLEAGCSSFKPSFFPLASGTVPLFRYSVSIVPCHCPMSTLIIRSWCGCILGHITVISKHLDLFETVDVHGKEKGRCCEGHRGSSCPALPCSDAFSYWSSCACVLTLRISLASLPSLLFSPKCISSYWNHVLENTPNSLASLSTDLPSCFLALHRPPNASLPAPTASRRNHDTKDGCVSSV